MLIPVKNKKLLEKNGIHFSIGTLRRWHCQGKNSQIFVKIGGMLCINLKEWEKLVAEKAEEERKRAERYQKLRG